MKRQSLYFVGLQRVEIRQEELLPPGPDQVQVHSLVSMISAGTETLIYKGQAPQNLTADTAIAALDGSLAFPLKYGYSMVGEVMQISEGVNADWKHRKVFAFNPHESAFNAHTKDLQPLPENCSFEDAVFLANAETAISLVQDGKPLLGEKAVILGQGVVGLLLTALLGKFPIDLFSVDSVEFRREFSRKLGANASFKPENGDELNAHLGKQGADLVYELSGRPEALNLAMDLVGEHGRIVVGSWYGMRTAPINLGEKFHRGRIRIISSQVSQLDPGLRGRWDKARRFEQAWRWVQTIKPNQLLTHRFEFGKASEAYQLLAHSPDSALGVVFQY